MPTEVVALVPENIALFARLYQAVFNGPPWNDGWSEEGVLERLTSFAQYPKFCGLGCLIDESPVALALGWGERWVGGWHFHIKELCVASDVQRQKIGTKLLSAFELELSRQGYNRVFLETGESAPARMFYEKHGYSRIKLATLAKSLRSNVELVEKQFI